MEWLQDFLDGKDDPATLEQLRRGYRTWLNSAGRATRNADGQLMRHRPVALSRCMGLPDNPEVVRKAMRDRYLRRAGIELERSLPSTCSVASALRNEAVHFSRHRWLCWCDFSHPPPSASELDRLLFLALKAGGGAIPHTTRQFVNILKS
jgi:hypothetical protein